MSSNGTPAPGSAPVFSERELQLLGFAMRSLKSGPPEIDYEKLASLAGMSNPRSASNAWAKIKQKLMTEPGADGAVSKPGRTPKKKAAAKKDVIKEENGDEDVPKKVVKKRGPKAQDVDGEESPKKKARAPRKKKADTSGEGSDSQADVKKEDTGAEESPVDQPLMEDGDDAEDVI